MFTADLSWADDTTEKVGERRQRKIHDGSESITSSGSSNNRRPSTRKGSLSGKTSFSSVKGSFRRPPTAASKNVRKHNLPPIDAKTTLKDPLEQPDFILSGKYIPKLPSGTHLDGDSPSSFAAEANQNTLEHGRILYSRHESGSPDDPHKAWAVSDKNEAETICQSYEQVKDEILALRTNKTDGYQRSASFQMGNHHAQMSETEPSELPAEDREIKVMPPKRNPSRLASRESVKPELLLPAPAQPLLELPAIFRSMNLSRDESPAPPPPPLKDHPSKTPPNISRWQAPSSWDIPHGRNDATEISPTTSSLGSSPEKASHRKSHTEMMSHFQRFVRRMEGAGPRIIMERLKEEWDEPSDRSMSDELQLEKHLWALTALQLRALDRFARPSQSIAPSGPLPPFSLNRRRKILELDGNVGEIYQLSAIYPNSKIAHLTSTSQSSSIPLPAQATQHAIITTSPANSIVSIPIGAAPGFVPLPYANSSMHHIRSARLASLLPAAQLPALLAECYRVLKPGGILELRLMDATPERGSMGPRLATWLEERLLLGLEREFRCQRPVMLVPRWAQEAGFKPLPFRNEVNAQGVQMHRYSFGKLGLARCLRLPAATAERDSGSRDVVAQVGVLVGRALWKDAWGTFVHGDYEENWWWDNADVVEECREWKTVWDVGTLYVIKEDKL